MCGMTETSPEYEIIHPNLTHITFGLYRTIKHVNAMIGARHGHWVVVAILPVLWQG